MNETPQTTSTENSIPTHYALRVKVAALCGWTSITSDMVGNKPHGRGNADHDFIPDFCNDLNACAEFEKTMTEAQCLIYNNILFDSKPTSDFDGTANDYVWHASAEQRCRAFVEVMEGKSVGAVTESATASVIPKTSSEKV